jgi:hypothetical protein
MTAASGESKAPAACPGPVLAAIGVTRHLPANIAKIASSGNGRSGARRAIARGLSGEKGRLAV